MLSSIRESPVIKRSRDWGVPCRLPSLVQFCGVVHNLRGTHLVGSPDQSSSVSLGDQSLLEMYGFTSKFLSPCWLTSWKGVDAHWRLEWPGFCTSASFSYKSQKNLEILRVFTQKEHPAPQEMKLRHKKQKIVLPMLILEFGYPSPQLHQILKPMRELFCTTVTI